MSRDAQGRFVPRRTIEDLKTHPRYKNGLWSYRYFRKDNCEDCGGVRNLDVHHLDGNPLHNEPENLKTLCHKCHIKNYHQREPWNKGRILKPLSEEHKQRLSEAHRRNRVQ